jgi:hypothetical protein
LASLLALPGLRRLARVLSDPCSDEGPLLLLSGLRRLILCIGLVLLGFGLGTGPIWLLAFALVFLAEEAVECTTHLAIFQTGEAAPARGITA